jgi:microcystin-dependent protein
MYGGTSAPTGWLACDGSAVSQATYADLYAVIGHTFGADPGGGNFILPNLVSKFARGSATPGTGAGSDTYSLSIAEANLPSHTHAAGTLTGGVHTHTFEKLQGYNSTGTSYYQGNEPTTDPFAAPGGDYSNDGPEWVAANKYFGSVVRMKAGEGNAAVTGSTGATGSGTAKSIDTLPAYTSVMYIIKY